MALVPMDCETAGYLIDDELHSTFVVPMAKVRVLGLLFFLKGFLVFRGFMGF